MSFCFPVNIVGIFRVRYERGKNESVLHVVNESFPHSNIQPMEACVTPLLQKRVNTRNKGGNVIVVEITSNELNCTRNRYLNQ